jgi:hypothetical protein
MVAGIAGSALVWQVGLLDPQAWCKTFLLPKLVVYLPHHHKHIPSAHPRRPVAVHALLGKAPRLLG